MCDPISLGTMMIAATAVQAVGQGVGALQANQAAKYEARVAGQNSRIASAQAVDAIDRGRRDLQRHYREASQTQGQQSAALAANGIDITFGSAAAVRGDTAMFAQEDAMTIAQNTEGEVKGFDIQGSNYRSQAQAARMRGRNALVSGAFGMASTVLGGATQYKTAQARLPGSF